MQPGLVPRVGALACATSTLGLGIPTPKIAKRSLVRHQLAHMAVRTTEGAWAGGSSAPNDPPVVVFRRGYLRRRLQEPARQADVLSSTAATKELVQGKAVLPSKEADSEPGGLRIGL